MGGTFGVCESRVFICLFVCFLTIETEMRPESHNQKIDFQRRRMNEYWKTT